MDSFAKPLRTLATDAKWFARATDVRVLFVRLEGDLRKPALTAIQYQEYHADNHSPWMVLEDAYEKREHGWLARAHRLVKAHRARRKALSKAGIYIEPVFSDGDRPVHPFAVFATAVARILDAQRAPLSGVVIVLAPKRERMRQVCAR